MSTNAERCKARYDAQRAKGECGFHPGVIPESPGQARCDTCRARQQRCRKARYLRNKAQGRCVQHPGREVMPGHLLCPACVTANRTRRAARAARARQQTAPEATHAP